MIRFAKVAIITSFIFAAAWLFTPWSSSPTNVVSAQRASPRSLYIQNCATCHGANGKSQTARGKELEAPDLTSADVQEQSRARIVRAITNGRPGMPGFKNKLTTRQISQIAGYVQAF